MTKEQAQQLLGKIAGYLEILRKDPHSTTFVPLSDAYRNLGMLEESLSVARHGIEALPFFGPGYVVLGRAQMQCGELDRAAQSFRKALEIDAESIAALKNLAKLCVLQGDREQACSLLARAVELSPDDPVLANLHRSLKPLAVEVVSSDMDEDAIEPASPSEPLFATATVADLYVKQGYLDKAQAIYRELLEAQPDDDSVRDRLNGVEALLAEKAPTPVEGFPSETPNTIVEDVIPESPSDVVAVLQRWLTAIQVRREHVQKHFAGHC
jgi:tetratricopeptide (TPR) repeat protein